MENVRTEFRAMGGSNEILVAAADATRARAAMQAAASEVLRIEAKYSRYRADSVVSRINAAAGSARPVPVDAETASLLDFADALFRQSEGLFDISSGILRRAWNFAEPRLPDPALLDALRAQIGWQRVQRGVEGIRLPSAGMEIDFGGFGKEYAADRAAAVLREHGLAHGYVNLGGDICALGPQPDGNPWLIGVQDPRRKGEVIATIPVTRGALATSGDYERYFELDGRRYCHVLDPRTGYPVSHWASVTVLAPMAIVAGSFSTIAMLKERGALDFLLGSNLAFLCVEPRGRIHTNDHPSGVPIDADHADCC